MFYSLKNSEGDVGVDKRVKAVQEVAMKKKLLQMGFDPVTNLMTKLQVITDGSC